MIYHEEGLSLRLKTKKKRISERRVPAECYRRVLEYGLRGRSPGGGGALERIRCLPQTIKVDGSEFISKTLDAWAHRHGREARVQPARQAYRQCFHRKLQWQIATGVLESELVQAFSQKLRDQAIES